METTSNLESAESSQVTFKKRRAKVIRTRPVSPSPSNSHDDTGSLTSSSDDELRQRIKRRKTTSGIKASSKANTESQTNTLTSARPPDREISPSDPNSATKPSATFKDLLDSGRATTKVDEGVGGLYKGLANQTSYIRKNPNAPTRSVGPVKAPSNVRTFTVLDYQPDTCKDYKTTGYCGFGDSCKFLHAREDYKQGWQLDKEWEQVTKGKGVRGTVVASANRNEGGEDADEDDILRDNVPFACLICKGPYSNPIVTKCGHYFCESCALKRYKKDPDCAVCGKGTGGVFNSAGRLMKQARQQVVTLAK